MVAGAAQYAYLVRSPWDLERAEYDELLADQPGYRLDQLWHGLHRQGLAPADVTTLPGSLRQQLAEQFSPALEPAARQETPDGNTVKRLWQLHDGVTIESVVMHYAKRSTVCISSQAGCAMACGFCATGQAGFDRHLSVGEMVEQVVQAQHDAEPRRLSNVVFMGMGEPFANYDRVIAAARRLVNDLEIGARKITISTVGLVPQIRRFADEGLQVGLAVSLHAANDELRTELVPINKRHPIADVVAASRLVREQTGRRVSFEWAMIAGTNDRDSDADELIEVAHAASAHVNLIPLNPTPGWPTIGSSRGRVQAFADRLETAGVNATVRANRGTDIDAACGQLAARDSGASN